MEADSLLSELAARVSVGPPVEGYPREISSPMATLVAPSHAICVNHAIPNGTQRVWLDFDGMSEKPISIEATVENRSERLGIVILKLTEPGPFLFDGPVIEPNFTAGQPWETFYSSPSAGDIGIIRGTVAARMEPLLNTSTGQEPPPFIPLKLATVPLDARVIAGSPLVSSDKVIGIMWGVEAPPTSEMVQIPRWLAVPLSGEASKLIGEAVARAYSTDEPAKPRVPTIDPGQPEETADRDLSADMREFDATAFFGKLSQSSRKALANAEAIRVARNRNHVHLEYLIASLFENELGPTRSLFLEHGVDAKALTSMIQESGNVTLPERAQYKTSKIFQLPAVTARVLKALNAAETCAASVGSRQIQSRHLLYGALSVSESKLVSLLNAAGITQTSVPLNGDVVARTPIQESIVYVNSDNPEGKDFLDIERDVRALSAVIAAKDVTPPISIGLFGDWGSGKSFFMRKMDTQIRKCAKGARESKGKSVFCENIVQIWFNAWSYMDTDLWASLATEIFEGLANEIDKDKDLARGTDPATAKARLLASMASARDIVAEEERKRDAAIEELKAVEQHVENLKKSDEEIGKQLGASELARAAYRAVVADKGISDALTEKAKELKIPDAERATSDLKVSLLEVSNTWSALRVALKGWKNPRLWVPLVAVAAAVALFVFVIAPFALKWDLNVAVAKFTTLLTSMTGLITPLVLNARRVLNTLDDFKKEHDALIKQKRDDVEEGCRDLQQQVQQRLAAAEDRAQKARTELNRIEQTLQEMRADRQLLDFIKERSSSSDYVSRLGTVARARRDFKKLSDLMDKNLKERREESTSQRTTADALELPQIDRIVLYIDDLDRCKEAKVVKVLEAVHLLLAFPLFVVVLGVDSRWLLHSLRLHSSAFDSTDSTDNPDEAAHWESTPLNYLEKIFQIPFYLRPMREGGFQRLVHEIVGKVENETVKQSLSETGKQESRETARAAAAAAGGATNEQRSIERETQGNTGTDGSGDQLQTSANNPNSEGGTTETGGSGGTARSAESQHSLEQDKGHSIGGEKEPDTQLEMNPAALRLQSWEREFIKTLHPLITSPRSTKRFVNLYRLIRVSIASEQDLRAFVGTADAGEHRAALLLLAILTGYPDEADELFHDLIVEERTESWWEYIDNWENDVTSGTRTLRLPSDEVAKAASRIRWHELFEKLRLLRKEIPEGQSCDQFVKWAPRVARYSFKSGRVLVSSKDVSFDD